MLGAASDLLVLVHARNNVAMAGEETSADHKNHEKRFLETVVASQARSP